MDTKLNSIDNNLTSVYVGENDKTISLIAINKTTTKTNFKFLFNNIDLSSNIVYYINDDSEDIEKHQQGCTYTNGQYMLKADGKSIYHIIFNKKK
jgi:O-glycosyl hydrolase